MEAKLIKKRDIAITLPSSISWEDYQKEIDLVTDGSNVMNFKVNSFPVNSGVGMKCYLCHRGQMLGWMEIVGMVENDFTCSTTGKEWSGKFIQRSGPFHKIDPIPMKGFRGFRYI
jgi:hypothetical protein